MSIQIKANRQYFPVIPFIMLYKLVLAFESMDKILKSDYSNQSYLAVLCCGAINYAVQDSVVLTFESMNETLNSGNYNESY